jgi:hypothetical protein
VNVCLKKDYFDSQYLNIYFLESEENQNSRIPKLNLIFRFNNEHDDLFEEEVQECESEKLFKLTSLFKKKSTRISKTKYLANHAFLPIIYNSSLNKHPKLFLNTYYFLILQNLMETNFHTNHLPPKNNYYFFNSIGGVNFVEILQIMFQNLSYTNKISKKSE